MGYSPNRSNNNTPVLTDMQKQYEAETGSTMFSKPSSSRAGRIGGRSPSSKQKKAYGEWVKTTAGMDAGKNRFNEMMANRSQNPVLGQTQAGMSGFDQFQAMQAGRNVPTLGQPSSELLSILVPGRAREISAANDVRNQQAGYDKFQAMQAARGDATNSYNNSKLNKLDPRGAFGGLAHKLNAEGKLFTNTAANQQPGYDRFQAQMEANPLILQQLQMGQRQMGPQFNAFGFGAQPGLAAQGGQGGSMLANMSSQGMNQLAAGQQNNPTIFKAKS